ncbi:insulinase family protein [Streptomyces lunaelactis]|uniref:M16 family metallopeptidase n=1 Tax=Streptomyces lunaelactis TaxID=1535768 RepID=UPI0015847F88|nr:M16 family metallopeptidase [Streptomyces lunaelactis]NUK52465.1 insulinase family protein [Streptomyces lunaelactis]NUK66206.1 insulinase family protein [Streptomyces lunaelactis]
MKHKVSRATLGNGLRVVVERQPGASRTAVCVHYGVGYRSERPDREGFAHLFEHLMFRGSASLPEGRFYDHIHSLGGQANGTTHQDYTDYHQVVPAAALEQALFSEADRMRAPRFTEQSLAGQLDGIEVEIHEAVEARPYGGFPWPLLPGVVFENFANAHDGYGRLEQLRTATVAECEEFFEAHYAPGNAVLTVVGDHDPEELLALAERYFGGIPARSFAPSPDLRERDLTEDRWATCTEPEVPATAVAVGYRLPDSRADMAGYLAHAVLAEIISQQGLEGVQAASAGCGVFGPLDARDPDLLVITALVPPAVSPRQAVEAMTGRWSSWADDPRLERIQAQAVRRMITEHHRQHVDVYARGRALGRLELLFGRAELLDELPARLGEIGPGDVAAAARGLHAAAKGVLVMAPGAARTRPAPARDTGPAPAALEPPGTPGPVAGPPTVPAPARPVPPLGAQPTPYYGPRRDVTLVGGTRVVAVRDGRIPLVELRLRLPLGASGWRRPEDVDALVHVLAGRTGVTGRAEERGGSFHLSTDGQWLDITGFTPPDGVTDWLGLLGELAAPVGAVVPLRTPSRRRDPGAVADTALRGHWLAHTAPSRERTGERPGLDMVHHDILRRGGGWLVAVGDIDPDRFAADAERTLSGCKAAAPGEAGAYAETGAYGEAGASLGTSTLALHHDAMADVHLTLSAPEPTGDTASAARYLATALAGAHYQSRMAAHSLRAGLDHTVYSARDICLGTSRAYVRATLPERHAAGGVAGIAEVLGELRTVPVTAAELEPIRTFCAAQLLGVFDSPAAKADLLRDTVSAGRRPEWAERLPELLRQSTPAEVGTACADLFAADRMTLVVLGRPGPASETADRWTALLEGSGTPPAPLPRPHAGSLA